MESNLDQDEVANVDDTINLEDDQTSAQQQDSECETESESESFVASVDHVVTASAAASGTTSAEVTSGEYGNGQLNLLQSHSKEDVRGVEQEEMEYRSAPDSDTGRNMAQTVNEASGRPSDKSVEKVENISGGEQTMSYQTFPDYEDRNLEQIEVALITEESKSKNADSDKISAVSLELAADSHAAALTEPRLQISGNGTETPRLSNYFGDVTVDAGNDPFGGIVESSGTETESTDDKKAMKSTSASSGMEQT